MPNPIKYSTSAQTLALKKGNFWIGTGDVGKGPTSTTDYYNGITPPSGGYTIYLNKASGGPSIYTASNDSQLISLTNTISVSTNLIKNNNGGNFADGTIAPFTGAYGTLPTIVDISNDKPYNGSTSTKAAKFIAGGGMNIYTEPSPFTMTVGVTYTFSFWYRQTNSNNFYIAFNNQGGSGDVNGNFQAYSSYGMFANPTQTWQRCSWTFTNTIDKRYFFIYSFNSVAGSECLMTEFTLTEGAMPGGPGLTTAGNCLNWFSIQTDKMIFNLDYPAIVTDGLVLNLDAGFSPSFATIPSNANSSTITPLYDLSGNGNNGTLTNGPTYSSSNSGSIVFDGVDDYVNLGTNASQYNSTTGTFAVWVKVTGITADSSGIFSNGTNDYGLIGLYASTYSSPSSTIGIQYGVTARSPNVDSGCSATVTIPASGWLYLVATRYYNGSTTSFKLYANGTLRSSGSMNYPISTVYSTWWLGRNTTRPSMAGNIAIAQMYSKELTAAEITQNYNSTKSRFGL
jgi:hypothetical protein